MHFPLTQAETELLLSSVSDPLNQDWDRLSTFFDGRTGDDLFRAYVDLKEHKLLGSTLRDFTVVQVKEETVLKVAASQVPIHDRLKVQQLNPKICRREASDFVLKKLIGQECAYYLRNCQSSGEVRDIVFNTNQDFAIGCISTETDDKENNVIYFNWNSASTKDSPMNLSPCAFNTAGHRSWNAQLNRYEYVSVPNVRLTDQVLVTFGFDSSVKFWNLNEGCLWRSIKPHNGRVTRLEQHPEQKYLFGSGSSDGSATLLEVDPDYIGVQDETIGLKVHRMKLPRYKCNHSISDIKFGHVSMHPC